MENDTGIHEKHCGGKLDEQQQPTQEIKLGALATQFCCLTEDGSQCKRIAGNASYSKRIQKTVQQKKLNLSIDNSARHVYICDYHKNMIQSFRSCTAKRKRPDSGDEENGKDNNSNDGHKALITLGNRGDRRSSINNNNTTTNTTTTTITATTSNNHQDTSLTITTFNSPSTSNSNNNFSNSVKNTNTSITSVGPAITTKSSANHIGGSSNDKMTSNTYNKDRKDNNNGSSSSNGPESNCKTDNERVSSYPKGDGENTQVDLSTLQMNTLRRYKRHYRVQTPPGINKSQLADTLLNHFKEIPIDEKEVITYFIYMVKCNRNKIDQMKGLVTSNANNLPYSGSSSPRNTY